MPPLTDFRGRVFFHCTSCGEGLSDDNFVALGLRTPDDGESRDDYRDAELIDAVRHADCTRAKKAG